MTHLTSLLDKLDALERAATSGPWEYGHKTLQDSGPPATTRATRKVPTVFVPHPLANSVAMQEIQEAERTWGTGHFSEGNAQLIVALRNAPLVQMLREAVEGLNNIAEMGRETGRPIAVKSAMLFRASECLARLERLCTQIETLAAKEGT